MSRANIFKVITFSIFALEIFFISWAGGGTRTPFLFVFSIISIVGFSLLLLQKNLHSLFNSSFFHKEGCFWFFGICIVVYSLIQSLNTRAIRYEVEGGSFFVEKPYVKYLPSSLEDSIFNFNAYTCFLLYIGLFCFFTLCRYLLRNKKIAIAAMLLFVANSVLISIFAIWQKYKYPILFNRFFSDGEFYGSFFISNACGVFLTIGVSFALCLVFLAHGNFISKHFKRTSALLLAIIVSYAVYESESIGAIIYCASVWGLALFIMFAKFISSIFIIKRPKVFIISVSLIVISISCIAFAPFYSSAKNYILGKKEIVASITSRYNIYKTNWLLIKENPIYGIGAGAYKYDFMKKSISAPALSHSTGYAIPTDPHSSIMAYLIRHGIIGTLLILSFFISFIYRLFQSKQIHSTTSRYLLGCSILCIFYSKYLMLF